MKKHRHIETIQGTSENFQEDRLITNNKENPFKVPDNYFEELSSTIKNRVSEGKMVRPKKAFIKLFIYSISTAAAVILFFLLFSIIIPHHTKKNNKTIALTDAEYKEAITEYLEDNLDEHTLIQMSSDSISIFDPREIPTLPVSYDDALLVSVSAQNQFQFDTAVSKSDIIDYLMYENIDPETL